MKSLDEMLQDGQHHVGLLVICTPIETEIPDSLAILGGDNKGIILKETKNAAFPLVEECACSGALARNLVTRLERLGFWQLRDSAVESPPLDGVVYEVSAVHPVRGWLSIRLENPDYCDDPTVKRVGKHVSRLISSSLLCLRMMGLLMSIAKRSRT